MNLYKIHALAWIALTRDDLPGQAFINAYRSIFGEQPNMGLIRIEARRFEQYT